MNQEDTARQLGRKGHLQLSKPILFEGTEVTYLDYDFTELTARDIMNVRKEAALAGADPGQMLTDDMFQAMLFCRSASQPGILALELGAQDFTAACSVALLFLGAGLNGVTPSP
jgi:hypothetical protein